MGHKFEVSRVKKSHGHGFKKKLVFSKESLISEELTEEGVQFEEVETLKEENVSAEKEEVTLTNERGVVEVKAPKANKKPEAPKPNKDKKK